MKIVFMGTPDFSAVVLEKLNSVYPVSCVVTGLDKPVGRGYQLKASPLKVKALELGIPVLQYEKVSREGIEDIENLNPDVVVTAAFGQILSEKFLSIPKYGVLNVHASLLPKLRGSSPIQWSIINGDEQSGRMERSTVAEQPDIVNGGEPCVLSGRILKGGWAWTYKPGGQNGVNWKVGTAYGFEFANLQLPANYLFGASYSKSVRQPVEGESDLHFSVSANSGSGATQGIAGKSTIDVYSLRPGASGALTAQRVATSENPTQQLNN